MDLTQITYVDVKQFLDTNEELLFNERDLQMHLAKHLCNNPFFDDVDLEYHIPKGFNPAFDIDYAEWETEKPSIDIVIRKGKEFIPIELKYKLKKVSGTISRFGEYNSNQVDLITNQAAQNLGRYAFWKDVKRLELLKKHFSSVKSGIAVFVTNDQTYTKASSTKADYAQFSMESGKKVTGALTWRKKKEKYPTINLDGIYCIDWKNISLHPLMSNSFYTIVIV